MPTRSFRDLFRRLTPLDRIALAIALLYGIVWVIRFIGHEPPLARFVAFLFFLSIGYLVFRVGGWVRGRLLWSLRNRLIIAYLFIAVVPVAMLLVLGVLSAQILYSQLGGYLFVEELQKRVDEVGNMADTVASAAAMLEPGPGASARGANKTPGPLEAEISTLSEEIPELEIDLHSDGKLLGLPGSIGTRRFSGLVQSADALWIVGEVQRGPVIVMARAPLTPNLLEKVATFLGPIQVITTQPATAVDPPESVLKIGEGQYRSSQRIATKQRVLTPASAWWDFQIDGISKLDSLLENSSTHELKQSPVFAFYVARLSALNSRLFSSLGELSSFYVELFLALGLIFFVLEAGALVTGIVLTRTITRSVGDLYEATQYVRAGDFSHRVRVERSDQLGALGESFNAMSGSMDSLIEEQRKRQRLENEVSIAHEVQTMLFPRDIPVMPGIQLGAYCRPARGVSGDYYDFLPLGPTRMAIALADISGKGISAALLMASVQAALRSQLLVDHSAAASASEVVSRINRHLYLNTSDDRFATFFFAIYNSATRILHYTNAGHVPPMCIAGDKIARLETGGTVVGVFEDTAYEEGVLEMPAGSTLVVYSDGLVEPENVYGEEFGMTRLEDVAMRHRHSSADAMVAALLLAAEEWAGTAEQADDMTVIVARLGEAAKAAGTVS
jgi:sigma-B regulation protein RsbU (phosphoserine phosphatase)